MPRAKSNKKTSATNAGAIPKRFPAPGKRPASPRKRRTPTKRKTTRAKASSAPASATLMRVDGSATRRRIKREFENAQHKLQQARDELHSFQRVDLPRFAQWLHQHFGALLTELRETARQLQELEILLARVENESFMTGLDSADAYHRVKNRREEDDDEDKTMTDEELFEELMAALEGDPDPGPGSRKQQSSRKAFNAHDWEEQASTTPEPSPFSRLKEVYRELVRRLHPDIRQKEMTENQRAMWHQVQEAYQGGNVEQLELLLAMLEVEENSRATSTSMALLQRMTRHFIGAWRQIQAQLKSLRKDPAWRFSKRRNLSSYKSRFKKILQRDLGDMQYRLILLQETVEAWEAEEPSGPKNRRRRRARRQPEPFFEEFLFDTF